MTSEELDLARAKDMLGGQGVVPVEVLKCILECFDPNEHYPPDEYYQIVEILAASPFAPFAPEEKI